MAYAINDNKSKSEIVVLTGTENPGSVHIIGSEALLAAGIDDVMKWTVISATLKQDGVGINHKDLSVTNIQLENYYSAGQIEFSVPDDTMTYVYEFVLIKIA